MTVNFEETAVSEESLNYATSLQEWSAGPFSLKCYNYDTWATFLDKFLSANTTIKNVVTEMGDRWLQMTAGDSTRMYFSITNYVVLRGTT